MIKQRIQVYADSDTKRRIELAAAKRDVAVTEYCLNAILVRLGEDELLTTDIVEIPINVHLEATIFDNLSDLHQRILKYRNGIPIDIDAVLDQVRHEREDEIIGLY